MLQNLAFGTSVQIASNNPQTIYVGGSSSPLPYAAANSGPSLAQGIGSFSLSISKDGGTNWQNVPDLPQSPFVRNWFVGQQGQVYVNIGGLAAQPLTTAVVGTAIAATAITIPQSSPQSTNATPHSMPLIKQPQLTPQATSPTLQAQIQRYDPSSSKWSTMTKPPFDGGTLLAVTPTSTTGDILWYIGISQGQDVLYRYTTQ